MSNGDSLDGFVFPPFIPPAAARTPAPPAPVAEQPAPEPRTSAPGRTTMPWDVETPIVRDGADMAPEPATDEAEDEDLPWLERPVPREPRAEAAPSSAPEAAPARDEAFPDWMAWDDRDGDEARGDAAGVAPVEGLEDFVPADDLTAFIAPPPAVEWAEAAPAGESDPADSSLWSLDAPEAVEPPALAEPAAEVTFATPAAAADAEPAFEVTLDDGALTFAPAAPEAADEPASAAAPEPVPAGEAPFVADADGPFVADEEAVIAAEPDPFTAASVHEAESVAPAESAAASAAASGVFADVAARLEDIARTLRDRPDDLLAGTSQDPLALLVAGYVMGYGARR
ncbi:MAG TPA: hypothetical protein VHG93_05300 [Longimicrobium sp.]|nr:hypothetical protein [Longimicrobium sp.]